MIKTFTQFLLEQEELSFIKVPFKDEKEEFIRTVKEFSSEEDFDENLNLLKKLYKNAEPQVLDKKHWKEMENTDSWKTTTRKKIEKAIVDNNEPRNIDAVIDEFKSKTIRCPIVLEKEDGVYYLIGGNTRLMVAKLLGIIPKIVVLKTDW